MTAMTSNASGKRKILARDVIAAILLYRKQNKFSSLVTHTNMAASPLSFYFLRNKWKPRIM
jgi:hypothetical protein